MHTLQSFFSACLMKSHFTDVGMVQKLVLLYQSPGVHCRELGKAVHPRPTLQFMAPIKPLLLVLLSQLIEHGW